MENQMLFLLIGFVLVEIVAGIQLFRTRNNATQLIEEIILRNKEADHAYQTKFGTKDEEDSDGTD